eukprot:5902188-Prymnesium_polylepis.1
MAGLPVALREGQAPVRLCHVHQHHARRRRARPGPLHVLPHGRRGARVRLCAQEPGDRVAAGARVDRDAPALRV